MWENILDFLLATGQQTILYTADGEPYAVELADPIGFTAYIGLAFVLYAIRQTEYVSNRFMPIIAIVLGLLYSIFVEYQVFDERSVIAGLRLGLLGVGSIATVKYFVDNPSKDNGHDTKTMRESK